MTFALLFPAAGFAAKRDAAPPPPALRDLIACRNEMDGTRRLACFDRASAALQEAVATEAVAVVDQKEVRATREALFGLPTPRDVSLIGAGVSQIESVVREATVNSDGAVVVTLESGQIWAQVDGRGMRTPRRGEKVTIRRATLGRLEAVFEGGTTRQFRRIQ